MKAIQALYFLILIVFLVNSQDYDPFYDEDGDDDDLSPP